MIVRTATSHDIARVVQLQEQWAAEQNVYGFGPATAEELIARLEEFFCVAEAEGEVVGFCYGSLHVSEGLAVIPVGEKYMEVDDLYVQLDWRRRHVGGTMLEWLLSRAKECGVKRFMVHSAAKDMDAILRFYRQHGFQSWYVQMFQ